MPVDPCVTPVANPVATPAAHPLHRLSHHIGSRHIHRLRHAHHSAAAAPVPADGCGKHFADGQPGGLAARPTDGAPTAGAIKGKAVIAKLAAATGSLLTAAAVVGALATPGGFGSKPSSGHLPGGGITSGSGPSVPVTLPPGLSPSPPGTTGSIVAPGGGGGITTVPEPSTLALFAGFAALAFAARFVWSRKPIRVAGE